MSDSGILGDQIEAAVRAACIRARDETLKAGVPIFYRDVSAGIDVMERPDGQKFEIQFFPGQPRERHFQILRELGKTAA